MKIIKITKFNNIYEAIPASIFANEPIDDLTKSRLNAIQKYQSGIFVTENKEIIYLIRPHEQRGTMVNKFEWFSHMNNFFAHIVKFNEDKTELYVLDEELFDRDELRQKDVFWTISL